MPSTDSDDLEPPAVLIVLAAAVGAVPGISAFSAPSVMTWLMAVGTVCVAVALFHVLRRSRWRLLAVAVGFLPGIAATFAWLDLVVART